MARPSVSRVPIPRTRWLVVPLARLDSGGRRETRASDLRAVDRQHSEYIA